MRDEQLIELVKRYPILYNTNLAQYREHTVRNNAWEEIAGEMDTPRQSISEPGTSEQGTREQNTNTIKPRKEKRANKRTYQESEYDAENQVIEEALEVMRRQNDSSNVPYVSFGMHIAAELRKYDATMFTRVKHSINTILYEADMELLNQSSTQEYNAESRRGYFTSQFTDLDSSSSSNMSTGLTQLIRDLYTKHPTVRVLDRVGASSSTAPIIQPPQPSAESPTEPASQVRSVALPQSLTVPSQVQQQSQPPQRRTYGHQPITNLVPRRGHNVKAEIDKKVMNLFIKDFQPFRMVEDLGFRELMDYAFPYYSIPTRKYFSNNMLPAVYERVKADLKETVRSQVTSLCVTIDIWTSCANDSMLAVTGHYIEQEEFALKSFLLDCVPLVNAHTAKNLADTVKTVCQEWNVADKILLAVTDNGANIKSAIERELAWKHFPYYTHTLNLAVSDILKSAEIADLLNKIKGTILHPCEEVKRELSGQKYITGSLVIPITVELIKALEQLGEQNIFMPDIDKIRQDLVGNGIQPEGTAQSRAIVEVQRYHDDKIIPRNECPLKRWREHKLVYTTLYKIAASKLNAMASSVPCERVFSAAGNILNERRTSASCDEAPATVSSASPPPSVYCTPVCASRRLLTATLCMSHKVRTEAFRELLDSVNRANASTPQSLALVGHSTLSRCKATFSGRPKESVEAFIDAVEAYSECAQVVDSNILRGLAYLFKDEAGTWWQGIKHSVSSWSQAKQNLLSAYGDRRPLPGIYLEIFSNPQQDENTDIFVARVRALLARLQKGDVTESAQLDMTYALLHSRIRKRLRREECKTFTDLLRLARNIEDAYDEKITTPSTSDSPVQQNRRSLLYQYITNITPHARRRRLIIRLRAHRLRVIRYTGVRVHARAPPAPSAKLQPPAPRGPQCRTHLLRRLATLVSGPPPSTNNGLPARIVNITVIQGTSVVS
ncbi:hypothetical protein HW555_012080 [Spodoptera exigua]|uniref:MADF domain-containing protein n=1 Tax=Spodoptera exigua TaxID=7107 RepID=A0A835G439_SPOEX|nr:hypothetical protein HW555_012080 [Spodoptera exigua]